MTRALDFCLRIADAHARLQRKLDDELGTFHGLSLSDFRLLTALADSDAGLTASSLSAPLGVQPSAVVRQVLALEKGGWVAREAAGGQRRILLRGPGRRLQHEAVETAGSICADAMASLPGAEHAQATLEAFSVARALELR